MALNKTQELLLERARRHGGAASVVARLLLWRRREIERELMLHEWISGATLGSRL